MSSVNKATILGSLGKDPEVRTTQAGGKIVNLSVATSERWNDKASGERKERTEWHRVVIMNEKLGDVAERFLSKGSKVYLEGSIQTRKWTDQSGTEKYSTEIVIGRFDGQLVLIDRADKQPAYGQERTDVGQRDGQRAMDMQRPAGGGRASPARQKEWAAELDDSVPFAPCWE